MGEKTRFRVAVAGGAGYWGRYYLQALSRHPRCEVVALVDRSAERRRRFAEHYGIRAQYDRIEELLARDVPDIVVASLPVSATHDVVVACAEAGVRVLQCEKPMAEDLLHADGMLEVCRERSSVLGCGTALYELPGLEGICRDSRGGIIGELREAAIPQGFGDQASGLGCVPLCMLRFATGRRVEWVEGWTVPGEASAGDDDCAAHGILGLEGGGSCLVPAPAEVLHPTTKVSLVGSEGRIWLAPPEPVVVRGLGAHSGPMERKRPPEAHGDLWTEVIDGLIRGYETGEVACSGEAYRDALEVAVALKVSARDGHRRVRLPLTDRTAKMRPIPYRWLGGDITGWGIVGGKIPDVPA